MLALKAEAREIVDSLRGHNASTYGARLSGHAVMVLIQFLDAQEDDKRRLVYALQVVCALLSDLDHADARMAYEQAQAALS